VSATEVKEEAKRTYKKEHWLALPKTEFSRMDVIGATVVQFRVSKSWGLKFLEIFIYING
jgi:hypothetical protein